MAYTLKIWNLNAVNTTTYQSKSKAIRLARARFNAGGVGVRVTNEAGQVLYEKRPGWKRARTGADNII